MVTVDSFNALNAGSWQVAWNTAGNLTIQNQGSSLPGSPPNVIQYLFPSGFGGGSGPGAELVDFSALTRAYTAVWWKVSNPWQGAGNSVNCIQYLATNSEGQIVMCMYGPNGGPYHLQVLPEFTNYTGSWLTPNVNDITVTLGTWHLLEWQIDYGGGIIKWWMDGQVIGNYSGVSGMPTGGFVEYRLNPTWGTTGNNKTENDYYWFDHAYIGTWSPIPAQVTDLAVSSPTSSSVTLQWTEVNDGTGSPSQYDVRYSSHPIQWGAARSTTQGSCTSPVAGTSIGSVHTCTVSGLVPSTQYDFEIVAFRGTLNQNAVYGPLSNIVTATTTSAGSGTPGQVTDLAASSPTSSQVTLTFTEVNNGQGQPSSYDVRYATGTIAWGSANSVSSGTCATPLGGTGIGNIKSCTVTGLVASTSYQFQLVAYSGTLNNNAVFGPLSNVTSATTTSIPSGNPGQVTDLAVTGSSQSSVSLSFTQVDDGTGHPASYDVRWMEGNMSWGSATSTTQGTCRTPVTGTVIGQPVNCAVDGLPAGSGFQFQVIAFRGTLNNNAVFGPLSNIVSGQTSGSPTGQYFTNVPSDFTTRMSYGFDDDIPQSCCGQSYGPTFSNWGQWLATWNDGQQAGHTGSNVSHQYLSDAPFSPTSVADYYYPAGSQDGAGPGDIQHSFTAGQAAYVGLIFKPAANWASQLQTNKIFYIKIVSSGLDCGHISFHFKPLTNGTNGPYQIVAFPEFYNNCNPSSNCWVSGACNYTWPNQGVNDYVQVGAWNHVEAVVDYRSGTSLRVRWWLSGALQGDYTYSSAPSGQLGVYDQNPVWGGHDYNGTCTDFTCKPHDDHLYVDHVMVATP